MQAGNSQSPLKTKKKAKTPLWSEIASITLPAFIELVMTSLFGMVDMIMVGQLGPAAITSVGLTHQPTMFLLAVFAAVNIGTTTLVAWNIGARKKMEARNVTRQTIVLNLILGTFISVLGIVSAPAIVRFMGARPDTINYATKYLRIIASGLGFQALNMGITASLRGAGETKIPMIYNVGSNLLNVFGNYVLIYGKLGFPRLEVTGAALSTTLARLLSCLAGFYVIYRSRHTKMHLSIKGNYKPNKNIIKRIFSIGLPAAIEQFILQGGLIFFARTVSGLGTLSFAAHQIGLNISSLSFSPNMAFAVASTTLVGQSLGAEDEEKATRYAHVVHKLAIGGSLFISLLFILFSHPMALLYTDDIAVAASAGTVLKIIALCLPGQATQLSLGGALRGAGDTRYPLYASAIGIWGVRALLAYIFVNFLHWGLNGAWIAYVLDQYLRSVIILLRFRSGKWKEVRARVAG